MTKSPKPPRLDHVAARAGVSSATVSRFINAPAKVAPETAERIRQAIDETGYVPNLIAGGLASNRSRLVALLVPDITHSIFNATIEAMTEELSVDGQVVMLGLTGANNERMRDLIEAALARRADAILLTGELADPELRTKLAASGAAVIETWNLPDKAIDVAVGFSHRAVGADIARFIKRRGYRRPHLLTAEGLRARARRDGLVAEWASGGHGKPSEMLFPTPTEFGMGRHAFRAIREMKQMPDVVICSSDWLAQGLIVEAQAAGLRVPDDLAVIGFGNLPFAADMRPSLTTVDIDGARIGRESVAILRRRMAGEAGVTGNIDIGFRLMTRESA